MAQWVGAAGDVASASTALAGLLLVFIGAVSTAYGAYEAQHQSVVRRGFLIRGSLALLGFLLSIAAAGLSLAGKVSDQSCLVVAAVTCLGLAMAAVVAAALVTVWDMTK
ncbi:MAG: hypothetical protein KIT17_20380 [Rubrivivax sp.]|nr:hypothetical protein [Rubrivivax sp.]